MLSYIRTSDTSQTGLRCLYTPHRAFYPRTSWLKRAQIVWPHWLYQPCPPLWISRLGVTGPYVQSEPGAITWTGPQISGRRRPLCPVRALRNYLDGTSDLEQKELVFVSFKKGFAKDISPATISSWIKQAVIICCELSDQVALTLHQVLKPMMLEPLLLLRPSSRGSP